jgi:hypothetical protein
MLQDRIDSIIADLGDSNDQLLAVLDDLWLEIDHTDSESIRLGSHRMIGVIEAAKNYQSLCDDLTRRLREFIPTPDADADIEQVELPTPKDKAAVFANYETIALNQQWSYRKPHGFILRGRAFPWKQNWIDLYQSLCDALRDIDAARFDTIPDRREIISTHGNPYFSRDPKRLRTAIKVGDSIYAESNLSAKLIRDNIQRLLRIFEIPESDLTIYTRN